MFIVCCAFSFNHCVSLQVGVWSKGVKPEDVTRKVDFEPDNEALLAKYKNKRVPAIVEKVIEGTMVRVELIDTKKPPQHSLVTVHLAGLQSPRMPLPLSVRLAQWERRQKKNPSLKDPKPTAELVPDKFAAAAQQFVELRLLQQQVDVILVGIDKQGNLYGHLDFSKGSIAGKLLENGLAKTVPWTLNLLPQGEQAKLVAAENAAKKARSGEWAVFKGDPFAVKELRGSGEAKLGREFDGRVVQVPSADTLVVKVGNKDEFRVSLASIAAPRCLRNNKFEPFAFEAREFVRKSLIGKIVHVHVDYERELPKRGGAAAAGKLQAAASAEDESKAADAEAEADAEEEEHEADAAELPRMYVTLTANKQNISVELVAHGLAEVRNHGKDDERAGNYEQLIQAEFQAKHQGKGLFAKGKHTPHSMIDLTIPPPAEKSKQNNKNRKDEAPAAAAGAAPAADGEKKEGAKKGGKKGGESKAEEEASHAGSRSKLVLSNLQNKSVAAVVEHVFTGSRMKLYVPSVNALLAFSLSGIRVPLHPKKQKGEEKEPEPNPLADEALAFTKSRLLHMDVTIEVKNITPKGDVFVGNLIFGGADKKSNLAQQLVRAGLAEVYGGFGAEKKELIDAERFAKSKKLKLWHNWDEEKARRDAEERAKKDQEANPNAAASGAFEKSECLVSVRLCFIGTTPKKHLKKHH